jgi:hypothetical protein
MAAVIFSLMINLSHFSLFFAEHDEEAAALLETCEL